MTDFDATYSPEDNKLRIYAAYRLDDELYQRVKKSGFNWAPKQELFVAPRWTPEREDLCIELAGSIEPEGTNLEDRAIAKAERFDGYAANRAADSDAYASAARSIAERFSNGQPILVGHHSEAKARRDAGKVERYAEKSGDMLRIANYWNYRASGVERFANMKNNDGVIHRRTKTLLTELRSVQRSMNTSHKALELWTDAAEKDDGDEFDKLVKMIAGFSDYSPWGTWSDLNDGKDARVVCNEMLSLWTRVRHSPRPYRIANHILNRLSFENSRLGAVDEFAGDMSAAILQTFARTHGAEKPKAVNVDGDRWELASAVPLPAHLASGKSVTMSADDWRSIMQSVSYQVPAPRKPTGPKKPPIINPSAEQAAEIQALWNESNDNAKQPVVLNFEQATFSARSKGSDTYILVELDAAGNILSRYSQKRDPKPSTCRIRVAMVNYMHKCSIVHITDKPSKLIPISADA